MGEKIQDASSGAHHIPAGADALAPSQDLVPVQPPNHDAKEAIQAAPQEPTQSVENRADYFAHRDLSPGAQKGLLGAIAPQNEAVTASIGRAQCGAAA
ncbi:MAG: hypothetical protein RIR70_114 [Pseudomonadota bacterium]